MIFSGRVGSSVGNVLTTLTTHDGVPHVRPGEPQCGCRTKRVAGRSSAL